MTAPVLLPRVPSPRAGGMAWGGLWVDAAASPLPQLNKWIFLLSPGALGPRFARTLLAPALRCHSSWCRSAWGQSPPPYGPDPPKCPAVPRHGGPLFSALNPEPGRVTPMSLQGSGQQGLVVAEEPGHLLPCCGQEWRRRRKRRVRALCRKEGAADRLCRFGGEILGGAGGCWVPRASRAPATALHGAAPVPANSGGPWQGPDAAGPRAGTAMPSHGDGPRGHSCWGLNRN